MSGVINQYGLRDLTGERFGKLVVLRRLARVAGRKQLWRCRCDCGTELNIRHDYLLHTNSPKRHCGCGRKTIITTNNQEYRIWHMMHKRCKDPRHISYKHYGGKGVKVCERWHDFANFLADMGPRPSKKHSLDREDSTKGYEPGNVKWATSREQGRNKRGSLYLPHPHDPDKLIPAAEVAEILGVRYQVMRARYVKEGKWPTKK